MTTDSADGLRPHRGPGRTALCHASDLDHFEIFLARTALGTINHSLWSVEALRSRGVPILGIAFVGDPVEDSEATIAALGKVRRLGRLPRLDPLNAATLAEAFAANFDLEAFR